MLDLIALIHSEMNTRRLKKTQEDSTPRRSIVGLSSCDYMLSIVGLSSCSCISSYSAHSKVPWVGGRHCVSMVLIHCLSMDTPYILDHVIDRGCDTPIESFVVHSLNIGARKVRLRRKSKLCS